MARVIVMTPPVARLFRAAAVLGILSSFAAAQQKLPQLAPAVEATAELPRVYVKTDMPVAPARGHRVIPVTEGMDLQAVLNQAQPGDVIELARGALFVGNFMLPAKTGDGWIVIRPSNFAALPKEGVRMTPTIANRLQLPRIISPNSQPAIRSSPNSHHYRFVGLDLGVLANQKMSYGVVILDAGDESHKLSEIPHDIILDRMYIHGDEKLSLRRCVALNSAMSAVIDSWLSDCHDSDADAQAIAGWGGPGPFKIVNNYLEASTENVLFGGSDPGVTGVVPSDIEFRRNHVNKPLRWKKVWIAKNLIEIKAANRLLVEGNIFEGSWAHGQAGEWYVIWSANQGGGCTWCTTQDVTIRLNVVRNIGAVGVISATAYHPSIPTHRIVVTDNIITGINVPPYDGNGRGFGVFTGVTDVTIAHNTVISPTNAAVVISGNQIVKGLTFRDNIVDAGKFGILADGVQGPKAFTMFAPDIVFKSNVLIGGDGGATSTMTNGNLFPFNVAVLRFIDLANGDVSLPANSPLKSRGSDGRDIGANVAAVRAATEGVRVNP